MAPIFGCRSRLKRPVLTTNDMMVKQELKNRRNGHYNLTSNDAQLRRPAEYDKRLVNSVNEMSTCSLNWTIDGT